VVAAARPLTPLAAEQVAAIPSAAYPTPARRPAYSALDCNAIDRDFGIQPHPWLPRVAETVARIIALEKEGTP
jgi:dTDP-4-dehydrorhamnose reductase